MYCFSGVAQEFEVMKLAPEENKHEVGVWEVKTDEGI